MFLEIEKGPQKAEHEQVKMKCPAEREEQKSMFVLKVFREAFRHGMDEHLYML